MDGKVERNNLPLCGKDEGWLFSQLKKLGYSDVRKVLLCYLDTDGQMTVHGFGEKPPPAAVHSSLRRCLVMRRAITLIVYLR